MSKKMIRSISLPAVFLFLSLFGSTVWAQAGSQNKAEPKEKTEQNVKVSLKWGKVQLAAGYEYLITDDKGKVVVRKRVKTNKATVELAPGQYFLQVAAVSAGGNLGEWSTKQTMTVYPAGSEAEQNARLQVIESLSDELSRSGAESELGNLGLGKVNMFGAGFDMSVTPVGRLYPFTNYIGGHIFFRYYKLFVNNLKPEFRLGFLTSYNSAISSNATLSMIKLYGYLNYSIGLFKNSFFLVPQIGGGIHYMNLAAQTFGRWYLHMGASAGLEVAYQPFDALRIFVRAEYIAFWVNDNFDRAEMILPSAGIAMRF